VWEFTRTSGGVTGFDEKKFTLDAGAFSNDITTDYGPGHFGIIQDGNSLYITFAPVPEPATVVVWALLGLCWAGVIARRWRLS